MTSKTLPLGSAPIIGYVHHAYPLSILATHPTFHPYFFSQYIQLYCPATFPDDQTQKFDFYRHPLSRSIPTPLLNTYILHRSHSLDPHGNIIPFLIQQLNDAFYIQIYANEYYIPERKKYLKKHYTHALLIFGYNQDAQTFDILGYNHEGNLAPSRISFSQLEMAFKRVHYLPERMERITLFQVSKTTSPNFDILSVEEQLHDYIFSNKTSERFRMLARPVQGTFGLETYTSLITYFDTLYTHPERFDIRPIHIFWEHKKCMYNRIYYMEANGYLDPKDCFSISYAPIEQSAHTVRMMMLKLRATHDRELIPRIITRVKCLKTKEANLLGSLLETLKITPRI